MTAPTPKDELREALARTLARVSGWENPDALWTDNMGMIARGHEGPPIWMEYTEEADALIAGPLADLLAQRDAAVADRDRMTVIALGDDPRAIAEYEWERANKLAVERDVAEARALAAEGEVEGWKRVAVIAGTPLEAMRASGTHRVPHHAEGFAEVVDLAVITIRRAVMGKGLPPAGTFDEATQPARAALLPVPETQEVRTHGDR